MNEFLNFQENEYDLDGLLRLSDESMADFIFLIQEDDAEHYYIDRNEMEKYDASFNKFMMRLKNYLEIDETRAVFVLFARILGEDVQLFDGENTKLKGLHIGELEDMDDAFYGMLIQYSEESFIFNEAIFTGANYQKDAHAEIVHHIGDLTELLKAFILEFK